jgi:hypothetical protein
MSSRSKNKNASAESQLARPSARSNGQAPTTQRRRAGDGKLPSVKSVLGEQLSGSLRESLIEQLGGVNSADEAAAWAHRNLPAKNTLTAADAKMVEERFKARLSTMCDSPHPDGPSEGPPLSGTPEGPLAPTRPPHALAEQGAASAADHGLASNAAGRQATGPAGPKIRAPSPGTCVGRRHFCGRSASTLHSVV